MVHDPHIAVGFFLKSGARHEENLMKMMGKSPTLSRIINREQRAVVWCQISK